MAASPGADHIVVRRATWSDYERLLAKRGEHGAPRISYLDGRVEIMSPGQSHEGIARVIGSLVEAWCDVHGIEFAAFGSWTIRRKRVKRGAEPDGCYVLHGEDPYSARRPDLAIEVVSTHRGLDMLEIWRKLGVPEVWVWDDARLTAWVKRGERFVASSGSRVLPGIDLAELASFVLRPGMPSRAIRAWRDALLKRKRRKS